MPTRNTPYATELASATFIFPDGAEGRIERLYVKGLQQEEIRFSWWKDGRMMMRPLDLPEADLLALMRTAIVDNVFSEQFIADLRMVLKQS
jgi:hypothetical protein